MLIELKNINKTYMTKTGVTFRALSNVSTTFDDTGLVFVLGKSGSGKSTMLNILGALDSYDSGEMWIGDKLTKFLSGNMLDYYRNTMVGFVFQEFNLINSLSVMENVKMALDIKGDKRFMGAEGKKRVIQMLESVGIADKARTKASNLSGGQRQRVAIARALIKEPRIILADEPTGSLDSATGTEIIEMLKEISKTKLVVVVTHDAFTAAKYGDRIIEMKDGEIFRDVRRRKEGESLMAAGVDIVSKTLVRMENGAILDEHFSRQINEIISESGRRTYINIDTEENRVKALFPNLRDAVKISRGKETRIRAAESGDFVKTEDIIKNEDFIPYTPTETGRESVAFHRSRMSFLSTLKMGIHNLKLKKFRLVMILIVTVISFTLFGAANTFSTVNTSRALAKSVQHDKVNAVSVSKNLIYKSDGSDIITDDTLRELAAKHNNCSFYKQYTVSMMPADYSTALAQMSGFYFPGFVGVTEIDDMSNIGFSVLTGTSRPDGFREAVISQYAAKALIAGGVFGSSGISVESLVGRSVVIDGFDVIIAGIYEADYEPYDIDRNIAISAYSHTFQLFVGINSGFMQEYESFKATKYNSLAYSTININGSQEYMNIADKTHIFRNSSALRNQLEADVSVYGVNPVPANTGKKEMLLLVSYMDNNCLRQINDFNSSDASYINIGTKNEFYMPPASSNNYYGWQMPPSYGGSTAQVVSDIIYSLPSSDYYISGYIVNSKECRGFALDGQTYDAFLKNYIKSNQLLVGLSPVEKENAALFEDLFKRDMQINSDFSFLFTIYMGLFLNFEGVMLGASTVLSLLAALLMFNFISTSIRLTKNNIGLMRALGVKKFNTFLVYVMEGLVIALITFAVSVVALLVIIPAINGALSVQLGMYIPIMVASMSVFMLMLLLSFGVSLLAIFVPWFKFTKITPVEAISGRG